MDYFYIDIETIPLDKEKYASLDEDERKKLLNPIDSRIIAVGFQKKGLDSQIFYSEDEKVLLQAFWSALTVQKQSRVPYRIVGFNIKDYDLPFLVTRSFINNVKIVPFLLKDVIDVREQLSAFKFGPTRGKLKEFGSLMGLTIMDDIDGSQVAENYWNAQHEKIKTYLKKDLEITQKIHERMMELGISDIQKW
jgi:predicted PolB exonuclease-like 3'-5' exonuclease